MNNKKKKGFSLVELIVVIAIIGILAAIAVPKYSAYKENANYKADVATAKLIADAATACSLDKNGGDITADFSGTANDTNAVKAYLSNGSPQPKTKGFSKFTVTVSGGAVIVLMEGSGYDNCQVYPNPQTPTKTTPTESDETETPSDT